MPAESPGWSSMLGLGAVIAGQLLAGLGLGWLVDSLADTGPTFLLVGRFGGMVGAGFYTFVQFRAYLK